MKLLKDIPTKNLVSIDIETVRLVDKFGELSPEWQKAWEYKNKQGGEVPYFEELADSWEKTASLYAEFSKICAISATFLSKGEDKLICKEFWGEDEAKILADFSGLLSQFSNSSKDFRLVGHAAKYFDYPFLSKRYVINGLDIPFMLDTAHLKPWESRNLCTNADVWKMGGTGAGSSLQAMCLALGVPVSKVDLVGDEVGAAYFRGEFERIGTYCSYDTIATFNVIRKIKKESIFAFDEVVYFDRLNKGVSEGVNSKNEGVNDAPSDAVTEDLFEKSPILIRVYNKKGFLEEDRVELEALLKSKEPTAEDIINLKKIILAHYQAKSDKVAVKKAKEAEVEEFVNSLYVK